MKALVIGGTGPSGPFTVNGLLERGYEVTVLHGGQHEVEFSQPLEHIHRRSTLDVVRAVVREELAPYRVLGALRRRLPWKRNNQEPRRRR